MSDPLPARSRLLTNLLDLNDRGLEIGPSYNPIIPKRLGFSVETVDHASREELVEKYRAWGHPPEILDAIEEVDHIWRGGSLLDSIPEPGHFGWIIGSHVLEHAVDLVQFLQDCSLLLTATGRAAFAIPDMRQTFDLLAPLTTVGSAVDRHLMTGYPYHTPGAVLDAYAHQVRLDGQLAWGQGSRGHLGFTHDSWDPVLAAFEASKAQTEYLDIHRWIFTPTSFGVFMEELHAVGLTDLRLVEAPHPAGHEFYATLAKDGPGTSVPRMVQYREVLRELAASYGALDSPRGRVDRRWPRLARG